MGGKRVGVDTCLQPKNKRAKTSFVGEDYDRISQLPDDILIDIVSLLPLKEAGRTSVLSSRWMNLWKHTRRLNFDADRALNRVAPMYFDWKKLLNSGTPKYMKWVDSVLQSHKSPNLKEYNISFHFNKSHTNSVTRWLKFAFARQVQSLKFDLGTSSCFYCFPEKLLAPKLQTPSHNFKSLKELCFKNVRLTERVIDFFLVNCPLLERLDVHLTDNISNLEVCGPSLRLKQLKVVHYNLKTLKVSLPNLTSLEVTVGKADLLIENVPMLVELFVGSVESPMYVKRMLSKFSVCISQLEILRLDLDSLKDTKDILEMPKLKKLIVVYCGDKSLVGLTALIKASPCLEEFDLHYGQFKWYQLPREYRPAKNPIRIPHHRLKVFKFSGYYGSKNDDELLGYILENCVVLEKVIVDPRGGRAPRYKILDVEHSARKKAKEKLQPCVPHHVELVILDRRRREHR